MTPAVLLLAVTGLAAAPEEGFSPPPLLESVPRISEDAQRSARLFSIEEAPVTPAQSFLASAATSFTGLVALTGLLAGEDGQPGEVVALQARLATALFLLSVGPSVGDLLVQDWGAFALGAGGRSALVALCWGTVHLVTQSGTEPLIVVGGILFVAFAAMVWTGWSAADLVRAFFAPDRWVRRQNEDLNRRRRTGRPPSPDGPWALRF